ncbi:MAG: hypothetical protein JRI68_35740 [Deltaproteobacteria bacterium]|nr:hypothetical protein [Deltaproteobacteria bacterium]
MVNQLLQQDYVTIRLRGKAYVLDTQYEKAFETDVHRRVLFAFRDHGVRPPAILHRHEDGQAAAPRSGPAARGQLA